MGALRFMGDTAPIRDNWVNTNTHALDKPGSDNSEYNKSNRNKNGSKKAKVTSTHYSANNTTLRPLSTHCLGFFSSQFIIVLMSTL